MLARILVILVGLVPACLVLPAGAVESLPLHVGPVENEAFAEDQERPTAVPNPGRIGLVAVVDDESFSVDDIRHMVLFGPDKRPIPLVVDQSSLFEEFGRIAAMRFYCEFPASAISDDADFTLQWGQGIEADNRTIERIVLDPKIRGRYRRLRAGVIGGDNLDGEDVATITVIADSYADWYFLWYLLPLGCVLVLLCVRKFHAPNRTNSADS